jgi:hypothetical protein
MEDLSRFASINAEGAYGTSGKYAFIPTTRVIDTLHTQGWFPVKAGEKRVVKVENRGFQEHLIRFRQDQANMPMVVGGIIPEIVVKNSHNGLSSFQIMAGLFRLVCTNGMVVADSLFATHRIKHIGYKDQDVIDATFDVINTTPKILDRVKQFQDVRLSIDEQMVFAESALVAKYGQEEAPLAQKFDLQRLMTAVRSQDRVGGYGVVSENTLWNSFNILQEKLVERGGRFARNEKEGARRSIKKARGVSSVSENVRINQSLWMLCEKMNELKGGI